MNAKAAEQKVKKVVDSHVVLMPSGGTFKREEDQDQVPDREDQDARRRAKDDDLAARVNKMLSEVNARNREILSLLKGASSPAPYRFPTARDDDRRKPSDAAPVEVDGSMDQDNLDERRQRRRVAGRDAWLNADAGDEDGDGLSDAYDTSNDQRREDEFSPEEAAQRGIAPCAVPATKSESTWPVGPARHWKKKAVPVKKVAKKPAGWPQGPSRWAR